MIINDPTWTKHVRKTIHIFETGVTQMYKASFHPYGFGPKVLKKDTGITLFRLDISKTLNSTTDRTIIKDTRIIRDWLLPEGHGWFMLCSGGGDEDAVLIFHRPINGWDGLML